MFPIVQAHTVFSVSATAHGRLFKQAGKVLAAILPYVEGMPILIEIISLETSLIEGL